MLDQLAAEPALFELVVITALVGVMLLTFGFLGRKVREARSQSAIEDFLLGIEEACAGEHHGAAKRLARVVAQDPENLQARLVLGEVLRELGKPVEAHSQHLQLQKAFGVSWPRNELALARCLLDVPEHAAEAVEPARRAARALPKDLEAARLVFEAEIAAGATHELPASAGRLARMLPPGTERERVLARAARVLSASAEVRRKQGDLAAAETVLARARELAPEVPEVQLLAARLHLQREGPAALPGLLPRPNLESARPAARSGGQALLGNGDAGLPALAPGGATSGHLAALAAWTPPERHAELDRELESPELVLDEVEENRAYLRRTIERAGAGSAEAESELVALREGALDELLATAIGGGPAAQVAGRCISRMGADIVPALFASYARLRERRAFPFANLLGGSGAPAVGKIAQGFGRDALPAFEKLLGSQDRELRKIAVDYYISLADPSVFGSVLESLPPIEIIHRLNATGPELLRPFLAALEERSLLSDLLLVDPTFHRDEELVHALPLAPDPKALVSLLLARGYDGDLAEALLDELGRPALDPAIWSVLEGYGPRALDHVVSAFADLDRPVAVRAQVRARLLQSGADAVPYLCACFGSTPSALDAELMALLVEIGAGALVALEAAYGQSSWVEKVTATFVGRYTHRRVMIVRTLAAIPTREAEAVLRRIQDREGDPNLKLRLAEALHRRAP